MKGTLITFSSVIYEILKFHAGFVLTTSFVTDNLQVGVIPMDESKVVMKGRLGPGMMIAADLETGQVRVEINALFCFLPLTFSAICSLRFQTSSIIQVLENTEVKKIVASAYPYGTWLQEHTRFIKPVNFLSSTVMDNEAVLRHQQ
jgi:glutamate synthase (ferredoxin)